MRICKIFTFDAAHRLMCHAGKCHNIHGHTYRVEIELQGPRYLNGMVLDFADLKKVINVIEEEFDHSIILNPKDTDVIDFVKSKNFKMVVMPVDNEISHEPTAENMAKLINTKIKNLISSVYYCKTKLYETPTSFAETEFI